MYTCTYIYIYIFFFSVNLKPIPNDTKSWMKARYNLGFLGFLGFALVYAMRVNLSVAIVSMVNQTAFPDHGGNDTSDVCSKRPLINSTFVPVKILFYDSDLICIRHYLEDKKNNCQNDYVLNSNYHLIFDYISSIKFFVLYIIEIEILIFLWI